MKLKGRPSPQFSFYPDDFLSSKYVLLMTSYEERGYMRLLMHMWNTPGCRLENNPNSLAQWSLLGKKWFNGSGKKILQCFFLRGRFWYNKRLKKEWDKQWSWKDKCSKAGRESGKIRRQNNLQTNYPSKDSSTTLEGRGELNANFPIPIPIPNKKEERRKKKESFPSDFQSKKNEVQNPFSELPYNQPILTRDPGYMEIILMQQDILEAGKVMTEDEALSINAAKVWAVYKLAVRGGMKFRSAEETITGYLLSDLSVKELQDQITKGKVPANAPIWNVLKPLQEKATQRAATKVEEDQLQIQRQKKEEQRKADKEVAAIIEKQNAVDQKRWEKEHPGEEFTRWSDPKIIAWLNPTLPKEDIEAFTLMMGKGKSAIRGETKKIGEVVTELVDTKKM